MQESAKRWTTYDALYDIPENMIGEIIDGDLLVTPRPSRKHVYTTSSISNKIGTPYMWDGRPGGWIILVEPEIAFRDNILVPDLAGWKKERFPSEEGHNWISVTPDWVCEIVSPSSASIDRVKKMGIYSKHQVSHYWIIDPIGKTLEVLENKNLKWFFAGTYAENDKVRAVPFSDIEIDLSSLWLENAFKES